MGFPATKSEVYNDVLNVVFPSSSKRKEKMIWSMKWNDSSCSITLETHWIRVKQPFTKPLYIIFSCPMLPVAWYLKPVYWNMLSGWPVFDPSTYRSDFCNLLDMLFQGVKVWLDYSRTYFRRCLSYARVSYASSSATFKSCDWGDVCAKDTISRSQHLHTSACRTA